MNEVKKARQQLDARNGIQPAKPKKTPKKRRRKQNNVKQAPVGQASVRTQTRREPAQTSRTSERQRAQQAVTTKRKRRRKKNYTLYYIILFLFIVIAGIILSLTVFFNIEEIAVEGSSRYTAEEIQKQSGIQAGDNLFRISTGQASEQIIAGFGYIDAVEITRSFPNKLVITVTEAKPVMSFLSGGSYYLVSAAGRILDSGMAEPAENTFVVNGVDLSGYRNGQFIATDSGQEMETLQTINLVCSEMAFEGISRVDINSVVDIRLYIGDRIRIDVGSITDLDYKLTFAKEVMDERLEPTDKGVIDVKQSGTAYFRPMEDISAAGSQSGASQPDDPSGGDPQSGSGDPSDSGGESSTNAIS